VRGEGSQDEESGRYDDERGVEPQPLHFHHQGAVIDDSRILVILIFLGGYILLLKTTHSLPYFLLFFR